MEQPPLKDEPGEAGIDHGAPVSGAMAARGLPPVLRLRWWWLVLSDAGGHLNNDDGWAMASHVALSSLMALFPFIIFVGALAGFLGDAALADQIADRLFEVWPSDVAAPIAEQVHQVLAVPRGGLLTVSILVALFLASNGLEALRAALNRAYRVSEHRSFVVLRAQSLTLVVLGAGASLAYGALGVAAPIFWRWLEGELPQGVSVNVSLLDFGVGLTVLFAAVLLFAAHVLLPARRPSIAFLLPGIVLTLLAWAVGASVFAAYLATFANYVATYAGLAGIVTAIFFLYCAALILIFGAEFNAAVDRVRRSSALMKVRAG
jgi:membrane protein